jgi:predicted alpha-1,2-mannosidase
MIRAPVDWVDPLIDTANRRFFFFSSACRPFGMVNLSPDTVATGAWGAGYRYTESNVLWFSHVHAWQLAGLPVLPTTGPFKGHLGSESYKSAFSHAGEIVRPGYHALFLEDYGVQTELTATDRVGFHRYTYPTSDSSYILFDLGAEVGPSRMSDCAVSWVSPYELEGYVENDVTRRRPKRTRIYFVTVFDAPMMEFGGWHHGELLEKVENISGPYSGVFVRYTTSPSQTIQMKVAISYCGIEQARLNLQTELPHWNFDQVRAEARAVWNQWLGRIQVEGGTDAQKTKFYTDLYHALLGRRKVSDVDGKYSDQTGPTQIIRQIPLNGEGKPYYEHHNSDSFWGAQWTLNVLWPLAYPEITHNFCNTLVDMYKNGGLIPRGPSGGNYTFVMTAATSTPLLVSAYQKGIRTFDVQAAYEGMVKNHLPGGLMSKAGYEHDTCIGGGVEHYIERGHVPIGIKAKAFHCAGAAQTLEYAYCDWCLAQMAAAIGKDTDLQAFSKRAHYYRNLYDPETGFMRPREMDGSWLKEFDPMSPESWVEGNGWQYLWHVPHDIAGLIELMGGRQVFVQRLNAVFENAEPGDFIAPHGKHHLNYLDYGNQPSTYIAHLFNYAGAPWLSQKWVRRIMEKAKSDISPFGGYGGDEDQGQMGALNVLMAIGLFNVSGGCNQEPFYEITSPVFDRVIIHLNPEYYGSDRFVIEVENNIPGNIYIQSASLNGEPLDRPWFLHRELNNGSVLKLVLGDEPNRHWGARPDVAPPSMSREYPDSNLSSATGKPSQRSHTPG